MPTPPPPPGNIAANLKYDGSNNPFVSITWNFPGYPPITNNVYRNGVRIATGITTSALQQEAILVTGMGYLDHGVSGGQAYAYYVTTVNESTGLESGPSSIVAIQIPYDAPTSDNSAIIPPQSVPPTPATTGAVVKWAFTDVFQKGVPPYTYVFAINPNDGGSPVMQKNFNFSHSVGPRRGSVIQEGASDAPKMAFSGVLLTREQYYAMEFWYQKRIMLDLTDDLGRTFRGALDSWNPKRSRRAFNSWYHTYDAEFAIFAWSDDTGQPIYGRFQ